jgi:hypothetical protein
MSAIAGLARKLVAFSVAAEMDGGRAPSVMGFRLIFLRVI